MERVASLRVIRIYIINTLGGKARNRFGHRRENRALGAKVTVGIKFGGRV